MNTYAWTTDADMTSRAMATCVHTFWLVPPPQRSPTAPAFFHHSRPLPQTFSATCRASLASYLPHHTSALSAPLSSASSSPCNLSDITAFPHSPAHHTRGRWYVTFCCDCGRTKPALPKRDFTRNENVLNGRTMQRADKWAGDDDIKRHFLTENLTLPLQKQAACILCRTKPKQRQA